MCCRSLTMNETIYTFMPNINGIEMHITYLSEAWICERMLRRPVVYSKCFSLLCFSFFSSEKCAIRIELD